ncbi:MAG: amidase [Myxococcota bacterium]|nr:amidase [Myxococcota bacterium]
MTDLFRRSALEIAAAIRDGEVSSREAVDAHIEGIEAVNPTINAVVQTRYEAARREADAADALRARTDPSELPAFHGVPCTIKECFALTGMEQTAGLVARKGRVATRDASAVERLRAAGAIPLGVTNLSELCMWMESNNKVYGRSNNPYDPSRIVGGSSGGEGAIVGAGASPFGLGSDIGGSIRMPAFFNGVFGHKGSSGLIPNTGQYPIAENEALSYLCTGPLCRRAEDLMPLLRVLAGPDGQDPSCQDYELGEPRDVDLGSLRVLDIPDNGRHSVSGELSAARAAVVEHLAFLGARVERPQLPSLKKSFDIWSSMMHEAAGTSFADLLGDGRSFRSFRQLGHWLTGRSPHTLAGLVLAAFEGATDIPPGKAARWAAVGRDLRAEVDDLLGEDGVLIYPSYPVTAPRHGQPLLRPLRFVYTAILNILLLPVTQVPLGLDSRGLPLGTQVAAGRGQDHITVAVAQELERAFGGWVPPSAPGATNLQANSSPEAPEA